MTTATLQFMSNALWRQVTYSVILPDKQSVGAGPYSVVLQLHGGNQNHAAWLEHSRLVDYARQFPFIIVLPDGAQSRWANGGEPFNAYEDFLMKDLHQHVHDTFQVSKGKWAIGGNSMGGFGAVRLSLKYPQRFFSAWSHSGGFPKADTLPAHWYWNGKAADLDCFALAERLGAKELPKLTFDCGIDDHLLEDNRQLHMHLGQHNIAHRYLEHAGGHDWDYWDSHIQEALTQHMNELEHRYDKEEHVH